MIGEHVIHVMMNAHHIMANAHHIMEEARHIMIKAHHIITKYHRKTGRSIDSIEFKPVHACHNMVHKSIE